MPDATLTSKGQVTIPKAVRDALGVHEGDQLTFVVRDDGVVEMWPRKRDLLSLAGMFVADEGRGATVEDFDEAIAQAVLDEFDRSR